MRGFSALSLISAKSARTQAVFPVLGGPLQMTFVGVDAGAMPGLRFRASGSIGVVRLGAGLGV